MKKIYITNFDKESYRSNEISPLVRPFLHDGSWTNDPRVLARRNCEGLEIEITSDLDRADAVLVSEPLNHRRDKARYRQLADLNSRCSRRGIFAHVFISGDYGKVHPYYANVMYYRVGGFKSQLNVHNRAISPQLTDELKNLFNRDDIVVREKMPKPRVGFCGHASSSVTKYLYEKAKFLQINGQRALVGDFNFEPLFSSAFERRKLLSQLETCDEIETNFVYRERYRAGASTEEERQKTTLEYYENIIDSDYVLCLRGGGNFSVRFYETLIMGRIPVFVNTNCILPFEDRIDWRKHVVWIEWKERNEIAKSIRDFHCKMSDGQFRELQHENRNLWGSRLGIRACIEEVLSSG